MPCIACSTADCSSEPLTASRRRRPVVTAPLPASAAAGETSKLKLTIAIGAGGGGGGGCTGSGGAVGGTGEGRTGGAGAGRSREAFDGISGGGDAGGAEGTGEGGSNGGSEGGSEGSGGTVGGGPSGSQLPPVAPLPFSSVARWRDFRTRRRLRSRLAVSRAEASNSAGVRATAGGGGGNGTSGAALDWQPLQPLQMPLQRHRSNEADPQMLGHDHDVRRANEPRPASMPCTSPPLPPRVVGLTPPNGSVAAPLCIWQLRRARKKQT
eukprot:scaffold29493_cov42-Phaeocystis_antarctica.AAC.5